MKIIVEYVYYKCVISNTCKQTILLIYCNLLFIVCLFYLNVQFIPELFLTTTHFMDVITGHFV